MLTKDDYSLRLEWQCDGMNILVCKAAPDRHNLRIPFVLICPSCAVLSEALGIIVSYRKFDSVIVLGEKSVLV